MLLATIGGCVSQKGSYMGNIQSDRGYGAPKGGAYHAVSVPGAIGPWGQPVAMQGGAPQTAKSAGEAFARQSFAKSLPTDIVQQITMKEDLRRAGVPSGNPILRTGGVIPPPGALAPPTGILPVAGKSTLPTQIAPRGTGVPGAVAGVGLMTKSAAGPFVAKRTSVRFAAPSGMRIAWYAPGQNGKTRFTDQTLTVPARYNFQQAAIFRLKLSNIPNHPEVELYPTLEVVPANSKTSTFLSHNSVPLVFTEDDFEQVLSGNYLVKVVYLPFPQFQDLAATNLDEISSARLEPGQDPIAEAQRRGHILLVIRMGNIDLEAPNTPPIDTPSAYQSAAPRMPVMPRGMMPRGMMPPGMMPPGMMPPGMMNAMRPGAPAPGMVPPGARPNLPRVPAQPTRVVPRVLPPVNEKPKTGPIGALPNLPKVDEVSYKKPEEKKDGPELDSTNWVPPYLRKK